MGELHNLKDITKEEIKAFLKNKAAKSGLILNIDNPKTIQDKIAWLIVNDDCQELKGRCADKILIHEYCQEKIGKDICVPILKIYDKPSDIDFTELPNKFVLKCNHGYAMNILVNQNEKSFTTLKKIHLNSEEECKKQLDEWLKINFGDINYQLHYALIEPKCFAESFIDDGHKTLTDYKVWCCNGEPKMIQVISDRYTSNLHANIYDTNWNWFHLGWSDFKEDEQNLDPKPQNLNLMLEYAKKLSEDFKFVRVDFYIVNDELYLGELTFTPDGGIFRYKDLETELYWGNQIKLEE